MNADKFIGKPGEIRVVDSKMASGTSLRPALLRRQKLLAQRLKRKMR